MQEKICPLCGSKFIPATPNQKFCSIDCQRYYYALGRKNVLLEVVSSGSFNFGKLVSKYGIKTAISLLKYLKTKGYKFEVNIW